MPANMMSAPLASTLVVIGSSNATVTAGPTPGNTPTAVPSMQPTRQKSRFCIVSATWKPCSSCVQTSIARAPLGEQRLEHARWECQAEAIVEDGEDGDRQDQADGRVQ